MVRHKRISINEYGGILPYLDATKDRHKGYGSEDLVKNWNNGEGRHMNVQNLAVMFNVSRPTIIDWLNRLKQEVAKTH